MIKPLRRRQIGHVQVHMAEHGAGGEAIPGRRVLAQFREHITHIQRFGADVHFPVLPDPLAARAVAVDLDAVAVRIAEIHRLADEMICHPLNRDLLFRQVPEERGQVAAGGQQQGKMIQPGVPFG